MNEPLEQRAGAPLTLAALQTSPVKREIIRVACPFSGCQDHEFDTEPEQNTKYTHVSCDKCSKCIPETHDAQCIRC